MSYSNYIWTKHARSAALARKIPQRYIDGVLYSPDRTEPTRDGAIEQSKKIDDKIVTVLIKKSDKGEAVIITCWVNPPFSGTRDAKKRARYLEMQKAGLLKKLWLSLLYGLGL